MNGNDKTPTPDPTKLTTDAVSAATDISRRELEAAKDIILERIDGDRLVEREKFRTTCEKFIAMETQFQNIESRRVEQKQDTKEAVQAALSAAKEAVSEQTTASERAINKSEAATTKSIDQLGEKFDAAFDGVRRDIDDLKGRLTTVESSRQAATRAREGMSATAQLAIAAMVAVIAVLGFGLTVLVAVNPP
jgi:cobalamin biosynthesis Mg chelatase CobN